MQPIESVKPGQADTVGPFPRPDFERVASAYLKDALSTMDAELRLGSETQASQLASGIFLALLQAQAGHTGPSG